MSHLLLWVIRILTYKLAIWGMTTVLSSRDSYLLDKLTQALHVNKVESGQHSKGKSNTICKVKNRAELSIKRTQTWKSKVMWGASFPGSSVVKNPPANIGDASLIPGSGRSPGEGNGNSLQDSYLGNSLDRGAWWATVHGITKSQTWLSMCTLMRNLIIQYSIDLSYFYHMMSLKESSEIISLTLVCNNLLL